MTTSEDKVMALIEAVLDNDRERTVDALKAGADPNFRDREHPGPWRLFNLKCTGSFLLYEAVNLGSRSIRRKRDTGVIEALIEFGAIVDMADDEGFTATHQAASLNNMDALGVLIGANADVNLRSQKGYTPLHTAIYGEADGCVEMLLNAGANTELSNQGGLDCMQYARSLRRKPLIALLESHAAMRAITVALSGLQPPTPFGSPSNVAR